MRRTISTLLHPYRTAAYYTASNPILRAGQVAYESDTRLSKVGDGATPWISLPYIGSTRSPYKPAGALGENLDRLAIIEANNLSCLVSGTVLCTALDVLPGQPVTTLFFTSGTTALVTGTNQWAGVCDSNYKILSISSDYTNTAWAINTVRPFTQLVPVGAPLLGPSIGSPRAARREYRRRVRRCQRDYRTSLTDGGAVKEAYDQ